MERKRRSLKKSLKASCSVALVVAALGAVAMARQNGAATSARQERGPAPIAPQDLRAAIQCLENLDALRFADR